MSEKSTETNGTPLIEALDRFILNEPAYFCIPGHRFQRGVPEELSMRFGDYLFSYDLTETEGLDDLSAPAGVLKESMENAARVFGADRTWFLVNGTSSGVCAMILACVSAGEKLIIARNSHRSALSGLILSGAVPVWVSPEADGEFGIAGSVAPEAIRTALDENPDAKAVFITSPTYYGKASDIGAIADICHGRGIPLLVDEAHGAHFSFSGDVPEDALSAGADLCAMSTHKTLFSMTQSSLMHYRAQRETVTETDEETGEEIEKERSVSYADPERVDEALKLVTTSSPSYILMASLDAAVRKASDEATEFVQKGVWLSMKLRRGLAEIPGVAVYGGANLEKLIEQRIDPERVVFSLIEPRFTGYEIKERLFKEAQAALETADEKNVVAVVTGANTEKEILQLIMAVIKLTKETPVSERGYDDGDSDLYTVIPASAMTPREAFFSKKEKIKIGDAAGRICASQLLACSPGVPYLVPGEIIDERLIERIKKYRGGECDEICVVER